MKQTTSTILAALCAFAAVPALAQQREVPPRRVWLQPIPFPVPAPTTVTVSPTVTATSSSTSTSSSTAQGGAAGAAEATGVGGQASAAANALSGSTAVSTATAPQAPANLVVVSAAEGGQPPAATPATPATPPSSSGSGTTYARRREAHSATAPALAVGTGSCMGSTSAGAQAVTFGVSLGSTWTDEACNRRFNAQLLDGLGMTEAAVALLCQDPSVERAMLSAKTPCPTAPFILDPDAPTVTPTPYPTGTQDVDGRVAPGEGPAARF